MCENHKSISSDSPIITSATKSPIGLIIDLLFNRACPLVVIPIGLYYAMFGGRDASYWHLPSRAELGISFWFICIFVPIGIAISAYLVCDYVWHDIKISTKSIYISGIFRQKELAFSDVLEISIDEGMSSSTLTLKLAKDDTITFNNLNTTSAEAIRTTIVSLKSSTTIPPHA